jgi:hypothetical protein
VRACSRREGAEWLSTAHVPSGLRVEIPGSVLQKDGRETRSWRGDPCACGGMCMLQGCPGLLIVLGKAFLESGDALALYERV